MYELTFSDDLIINDIFQSKGWLVDKTNKSSLYNRFRSRCKELNDEERDLFYKLTLEFRWVSLDEYMQLLSNLLSIAVTKHINPGNQHIYVYPIKKEEDHDLVKSSDVISYFCKSTHIKFIDALSKKTFKVITTQTQLINKTNDKPFLILDDYIGSGKYAISVAEELIKKGVKKSNIIICTLFISENGARALEDNNYIFEYVEKAKSALTKLSPKEIKLLDEIENMLKIDKEYSRGYEQSANLISLIRTPNNTLPLFWHKNSSRVLNAPFERRKEK